MSWRCLEDIFSVTNFHLPRRPQDTSCKSSSKDVFKTSSRCLRKKYLQDVVFLKTSSRRLGRQKSVALKTSSRRFQDVFNTSSPRRMFAVLQKNIIRSIRRIEQKKLDLLILLCSMSYKNCISYELQKWLIYYNKDDRRSATTCHLCGHCWRVSYIYITIC